MKLPLFLDKTKTLHPALIIIPFLIVFMLNVGFGAFAVILIINETPFSWILLLISQIFLWVFAYGGLHWINRTYFSTKKEN